MNRRLGWLFALAVILPSALLAALAVRAIRREEAFIEKRLAAGLSAEVLQLAASVTGELRRVEEELARAAPGPNPAGLRAWKKDTPLVGVPFLLTAAYELAWPRSNQGAAEREFLQRHGEFLAGRQQVPVYTNIALAYQEEILRPAGTGGQPPEVAAAPARASAVAPAAAGQSAADTAAPAAAGLTTAKAEGEAAAEKAAVPRAKAAAASQGPRAESLAPAPRTRRPRRARPQQKAWHRSPRTRRRRARPPLPAPSWPRPPSRRSAPSRATGRCAARCTPRRRARANPRPRGT